MTQTASSKPRAILTMGVPAAGKSTVTAQRFPNLTVVDCDIFKPQHPKYDPKAITEEVHAWSQEQCQRALYAALGSGRDFVYDSTGTNAERMVEIIKQAQSAGFETVLVYVTVSLQTAIARNNARARTVPETILRQKYSTINTSFEIVRNYADVVEVINSEEAR